MKLRTSFCNKTLLRKNIARFAPIWGLYQIFLLIGLGLMYMEANNGIINFWFASYMAQCIQVMGLVNLFFAPAVASLLFGDLFNSRMCNALHAMPLRRETVFVTNVASGLLFSLVPTAVMALLSIPLLMGTVVHNAWQIAVLWFVGTNLEFVCYFGMAVFCIFCTGSRLGFTALYALLNGGAYLIFVIVDMLYTPMLYGVVTPTRLVELLTPIANLVDETFVEVGSYHDMLTLFEGRLWEATADFWVKEAYCGLPVYGLVGLVFLVLGLLLYRRRDLECAGDAVAVKWLAPVFQLAAAIAGGAMAALCLEMFFYSLFRTDITLYAMALCGMAVGWFLGRMVLERTTRVFRLRSWVGLGILTAFFAVSLVLTRFDVFGSARWTPNPEDVSSVTLSVSGEIVLTEQEDIEQMIRLQELALEDQLEQSGRYPASYVESFGTFSGIPYPEEGFSYGEGGYDEMESHYSADWISLTYQMADGREVVRRYTVWTDFEEGEIIREYASRWETVWKQVSYNSEAEPDFTRIHDMTVNGGRVPRELMTPGAVEQLLDAIRADCEARTMTQDSYYHTGRFKIPTEDPYAEQGFYYNTCIYVDITTYAEGQKDLMGVYFQIFADSENTLRWLEEQGVLDCEVVEGSFIG